MAIINRPNTYSPNTSISSSEVNDDFDTIYNEFNGSIAAANLATNSVTTAKIADSNVTTAKIADANVTNAKLTNSGSFDSSWAWASWTPTLSGRFNNSKWTKACKFVQIGKTVFFRLSLVASTTTPMDGGVAEALFTLPITSVALPGVNPVHISTNGRLLDSGTASYLALAEQDSTTTARVRYIDTGAAANASIVAITSTAPFTWTTSDEITVQGFYEAA